MFRALSATPLGKTKVVILGQDPYPDAGFATGLAFSIPPEVEPTDFPPTLRTIFAEYSRDLGYPSPSHGDLTAWAKQGVLLWNSIPSCRTGKSLSHDWPDSCWDYLTREIIQRCDEQGVVFAFLGAVAKRHLHEVKASPVIQTSHPSPRGSMNSRTPFNGSRLFSEINRKLIKIGREPIDWRLDGIPEQRPGGDDVGGSSRDGTHRVLVNQTGVSLGRLENA
jgi:uracil-DNA glycosylase